MSLPELVSIDQARQEFAGLIPSRRYVEQLSRKGAWPRLYRSGLKSPGFFRRDELERFLAERLGSGGV